ncbi:MAG: thiol reductant ABC exporter subunit CydC [Chloroflexota bacterium]|nr:thiol reductant ABC exporter subunit CydC [Chloroflexota bacterium]
MTLIWRLLHWDPPAEVAPERWPTGLRGLTAALRPYWGLFVVSVVAALINHGSTLAAAALSAYVVGAAVTGASFVELAPLGWILLALVLVRVAAEFVESWISHDLAFRLLAVIRHWIYWGVERIAPGGLVRRRSGDIAAAGMQDAERLEIFYAHLLIELIVAVSVPFAATAILLALDPRLPIALVPFLILMATVPVWLMRLANRQGREVRDHVGELQSDVVDGITGLREVVLFGREREWLARLDAAGRTVARAQLRYGLRAGLEVAASNTLAGLGILSVLLLSALAVEARTLDGRLAPVAVTLAVFAVAAVARFIAFLSSYGGQLFGSADRIFGLLNSERAVDDRTADPALVVSHPEVEFDAVSFRYQPTLEPAIRDVSFTIRPGQTVAVVGPSGAGKSTCAYLLMRFWDVESGSIRLGGHDLRQLPAETVREVVGYVPQDPFLFHSSVADNIRVAKPEATDEEVRAAARTARAHDFIERMPQGYETVVGERGARLSGGERQRIAIARALLKDAPILVLDEPTSMLDAFSERELRQAMDESRAGRTVFVIAHRLATIRDADRILVLDSGSVVDVGTHTELLAREGLYARLVRLQREGILAT